MAKLTQQEAFLSAVQPLESLPDVVERVERIWKRGFESAGIKIAVFGQIGAGKSAFISHFVQSAELLPLSGAGEVERIEQAEVRRLPETIDVRDRRIRELEQKCDELRVENQLLQSRASEARRTAARETQRYDQLLEEFHNLQAQNDNFLSCLMGRMQAADTTASLLLDKNNARLRMIERYEGVVEHVHGNSVTVVFDIDDDVVEHKYEQGQFIDGQLPEEGDRLTVYVHVVHGSVETEDDATVEADQLNEHDEYERKKITGPIEF